MGEPQAVPERFRPVLAALIEMIAADDVAAIQASPVIQARDSDPLLWARDYPGAVMPLPPEGWEPAGAFQLSGQPRQWLVVIPLWTAAEGMSDLTLEATIEDRAEGPVVEIDNIHVL